MIQETGRKHDFLNPETYRSSGIRHLASFVTFVLYAKLRIPVDHHCHHVVARLLRIPGDQAGKS
jgi:hypothetical protein